MKILEIIPSLSSGGAERFTVDLCNELSKNNEVYLVVLFSLDNNKLAFYKNDISSRVNVISLNKKKGFDFRIHFKIYKLIKKINPDVVHTHLAAFVYSQLTILLYRKAKYFHTVHNAADKEAGHNKYVIYLRKNSFKKGLVTPVAISDDSARSFREFYSLPVDVIFNGRNILSNTTSLEQAKNEILKFRKTEDTRILINLARVELQKRQDKMAKAVKRLETEGYNFCILNIGSIRDESMYNSIQDIACNSFVFLGERHNPLDYLLLSDGFTLSSDHEGMPISLIEALGTGCVPVFSPVGGIVDVIKDGINGYLANDISEEAYYCALKRFITTSKISLLNMKQEALKSYKPFSMNECANKYEKMFLHTVQRII